MKELYSEAFAFYQDESYYRAQTRFEELIERDPLNKFAVQAELHLAEILFIKENYDESIIHYNEYLRLNPKAVEYEYILYRIGMCHFNMMRTYDRDQTQTSLALEKFREYLDKFPDGQYIEEVCGGTDIALQRLLESEFNVGMFYYNMEKYSSAVTRFNNIIKRFTQGEQLERSYYILAKSLDNLLLGDELMELVEKYAAKYPNGQYKEDMNKIVQTYI